MFKAITDNYYDFHATYAIQDMPKIPRNVNFKLLVYEDKDN